MELAGQYPDGPSSHSGPGLTLTGVATDVRGMTARVGPEPREVIAGLADELERGGAALAGVDLVAAYPPHAVIPDGRFIVWSTRLLELLRDGLLFVPIWFTWRRLSEALSAYTRSKSTESFLAAWQGGVGGSTLSATASDVAAIVMAVIVLTIVLHALNARADGRELLRDQLGGHLLRATLLLAQRSPAPATQVSAATLNRVGAQIAQSSEQLRTDMSAAATQISAAVATGPASALGKALKQLEDSLVEWRASAALLHEVAANLQLPQETLTQTLELHAAAAREINRIEENMDRLIVRLGEAGQSAAAQAHAQRRVSDDVAAATGELGRAMTALNHRAEVFGEIVNLLRAAAGALDGQGFGRLDGRQFDSQRPVGE